MLSAVVFAALVGVTERPNVVVILADDLAWNDLEQPQHATPHLDRFAAQSCRFTQAYAAAPICSASRAALLTGRSPARLHFEFVTKAEPGSQPIRGTDLQAPPYTLDLPESETTVAELLREGGYATALVGKWHLNRHHGGYLRWHPERGPMQHGFDVAVQTFGSHPYGRKRTDEPAPLRDGAFPKDELTERACEFVRSRADSDQPFFLLVSHYFVHTPVRSTVDWLERDIRRQFPDLDSKRVQYAVFVRQLDHLVGQLLAALDDAGVADDTLVLFTSDNGGDPRFVDHGPLRGHKWSLYEGGIRVPWLVRWPGVVQAGATQSSVVVGTDLLPTLAELAGVALPARPLDGVSIVPLLRDSDATLPPRTVLWSFPYYHPELEDAAAIEEAGVNDGRVPFLEPHAAVRVTGDPSQPDRKLLHFFESQRTEGYVFDESGFVDETQPLHWNEAERQAATEVLFTQLHEHSARLPQPRSRKQQPAAEAR